MEPTNRKYTVNDIGCYGESSRGIYLGQHVQEIAMSSGMQIEPIGPWYRNNIYESCVLRSNEQINHAEEYTWRTDEALDWLNSNTVDSDVLFEFIDGEFFLSSIAQREEEENFLV